MLLRPYASNRNHINDSNNSNQLLNHINTTNNNNMPLESGYEDTMVY